MINAISLVGKLKTGKTTFALSAPKPMVFFDFEMGYSRVEPRFIDNPNEITIHKLVDETLVNRKKKENIQKAIDFWENILTLYNDALENPNVKSIVFDTFTSVWEARRMAHLATIRQTDPNRSSLMPPEYFIPNTDIKVMLVQARVHDKILIVTHHTRPEYMGNEPTGKDEPDGFKKTGDLVDVVLWTDKQYDKQSGITVPVAKITECGLTMQALGMELVSPTYDSLDKLITGYRQL